MPRTIILHSSPERPMGWEEAAAFARTSGLRLPTVYESVEFISRYADRIGFALPAAWWTDESLNDDLARAGHPGNFTCVADKKHLYCVLLVSDSETESELGIALEDAPSPRDRVVAELFSAIDKVFAQGGLEKVTEKLRSDVARQCRKTAAANGFTSEDWFDAFEEDVKNHIVNKVKQIYKWM